MSTVLRGASTRRNKVSRLGVWLHRYLTLGVFAIVLAIGAYTIKQHPAEYASTGTVVFVGSDTISQREARSAELVDPTTQSVLSRFPSLMVVGDIFSRTYQSWGKRMSLQEQGLRGRLLVSTRSDVSSDTPDHGPVIVFTVVSADPLVARDGVKLVIADLQKELERWQRGADPTLSVSDQTISAPQPGVIAGGSKSRATVGFVVLAALLAWLVGQLDRWLRSRRLLFRRPI